MKKEEELWFLLKIITFPVNGFCFSEKNRDILRRIKPQETKMVAKIFCCYNPYKHLIKGHLRQLKNAIDFHSKSYENTILIGDFNVEISDSHVNSFCAIYHLKSLI